MLPDVDDLAVFVCPVVIVGIWEEQTALNLYITHERDPPKLGGSIVDEFPASDCNTATAASVLHNKESVLLEYSKLCL